MQSKKINKVRTFLLIQTDHEIKEYLKKSFTYINTKSPKDLATQYDNDYVVNFDNSIANNLNMSNTTTEVFLTSLEILLHKEKTLFRIKK